MAIDRIGKGAGLPPAPEAQGKGTGATAPTGAKFEVGHTDPADKAGSAARTSHIGATSGAPLERLRAGEVDVHGYIDLKVDEATAALKGLSTSQLDEIKSMLRDQMKTDPGLAELVGKATGKMPTPPED